MKKIFLLLILVLSIFGIFKIDHNFSKSYHSIFTKSTDLKNENIDNISLGYSINSQKITSKYKKIKNKDNSYYDYYNLDEGFYVATKKDDDKIIRFIVNNKNINTKNDVIISDNIKKVIDLYGDNYYYRTEQGTNIIGYVDKKSKTFIEFWLNFDKLDMIRYEYHYVK